MLYDAIIIGAGPIGIEMASVLRRADISYVHLESGPIGSAIARWPRNTTFFSSSEWVSLAGVPIHSVSQTALTGEEYLAYLRSIVETLDLPIKTYESVVELSGRRGGFSARTRDLAGADHVYRGRTVILATGDLNRPRMIGVSGEELPHVTHYWNDPHDYFQRELLIVGGRNAAIEAAVRCWRAGARVTLSYRRAAIDEERTISRLALEVRLLIEKGRIRFLPESRVREFHPGVTIMEDGLEIPTDFAYLATGYEMDFTLYDQLGIRHGDEQERPEIDPRTMESNVEGAYVVGTATGGNQNRFTVFITTSHEHCLRAARSIAPDRAIPEAWVGNLAGRNYPLASSDIE